MYSCCLNNSAISLCWSFFFFQINKTRFQFKHAIIDRIVSPHTCVVCCSALKWQRKREKEKKKQFQLFAIGILLGALTDLWCVAAFVFPFHLCPWDGKQPYKKKNCRLAIYIRSTRRKKKKTCQVVTRNKAKLTCVGFLLRSECRSRWSFHFFFLSTFTTRNKREKVQKWWWQISYFGN